MSAAASICKHYSMQLYVLTMFDSHHDGLSKHCCIRLQSVARTQIINHVVKGKVMWNLKLWRLQSTSQGLCSL